MRRLYRVITLSVFMAILCGISYSTKLSATPLYSTDDGEIDTITVRADGIDTQSANISCGNHLSRAQLWVTWGSDGTSHYYESKDFIKPQPNVCNVLFQGVEFPRDFYNQLEIWILAYNDEGQLIKGTQKITRHGAWDLLDINFGYVELDVPPQAAPDKPSLLNPSNGATVSSETDTVLEWSQAARATEYAVELYTPSGTRQSGRIGNTNWNAGKLQPGNYTWRVEAYNANGYSGWTDSFSFTVSAPLATPDKPTLQSPINDTTLSPNSEVTLQWNSAPRATEYFFELWRDNNVIKPSGHIAATSYNVGKLQPGSYWWQVYAKNSAGFGPWSDKGHFSVVESVTTPDKPTLLSPLNGATVSSETDTVLQWSQAARATEYAVELYTSSGIRQSGHQNGTTWNAGRLQLGNYTWRVEAYNTGHWSGWTDSFSFAVSAPVSVTPSILDAAYQPKSIFAPGEKVFLVATIKPVETQEMEGNIRCQSYDKWDAPSLNLFFDQPIVVGAYGSSVLHGRTVDADARFGDYTLRCKFEGDGFTVESFSVFNVRAYLFLPQIRSQ